MLDQGTVIGGYRLEGELGRGGMGTVFRARHLESGRLVALKLMSDGEGDDARFHGEGRAQASLEHPHVVTVYEAGTSEYGPFLAMRLVDGPSLADLLREREVGARRALDLLEQVADALDAAHARRLVHRDVKPRNVLVDQEDQAFLADFGLTRGHAQPALTATGDIVGTVAYLAPEVVRGDQAGPASDRYAFAATLFECLTGSVVFPRSSDAAVLFAHADDPPPRIGSRRTELGDDLNDLFVGALAKKPAERPATARQLVDAVRRRMERAGTIELGPPPPPGVAALALHDATTDSSIAVPARGPEAAPARPRRRMIVLAALAGAAAVGAAWLAFGGDEAEQPVADVAPDRSGLQYVGADLNGATGRPLDCRGRAVADTSPACTVVQSDLPGGTVVIPKDGVIRHWSVRGARGELALAVLRPREGGAFQLALSATETVGSADVHSFDTDIEVERGDLVGLRVPAGSAVGVRDGAQGATTDRWMPPVTGFGRKADRRAGSGFDHELLLRVGVLPGGKPQPPPQWTGREAERLPAGRVREREHMRIAGRRVTLALVERDGRFVVDELIGGRRVARIAVPGMRPRAQTVLFYALAWGPDNGGLDVQFVNEDSAKVVQYSYAVNPDGFIRIR